MNPNLIPSLDAAGLPGPPWLFHVLLVFTFFLHVLFMNLALGGTLLAWIAHLRSGRNLDDPNAVLAGRMVAVNGFAISLTITTGVAPLLFIQALYQQFFYSGTILLGWIWFGFLGLLTLGYYAVYLYKLHGSPESPRRGIWLGAAAVAFLLIAMTHVGVHLVHVQAAQWPQFAANPWSVLGDRTYWPRFIHFVLAGTAFSALVTAWWAARRAAAGVDVDVNTAIARTGWRWALWATVLQVVDGFILLLVLPGDVLSGVMRGGAAVLVPLTVSILLGIGLLVMLARKIDPVTKLGLLTGTLAAAVVTVAVMSITRHQVRVLYLDPATSPYTAKIVPQWGNFFLFVVMLLIAVGTVAYFIRRVMTEPASGEDAA